MSVFKDAGHLFRFAGLFVLAFLVFLVVRHYVVPKSFGQYGHYRGAAMGEIAAHPVKFVGHDTCEGCHADVADAKKAGEACTAGYGSALRPLPHGQRGQTQGLSAGCAGGSLSRAAVRDLPQAA